MKINLVLISFFGLAAILSITIESVEGIIGGRKVIQGLFKYNVAIKINGPDDICNGVIIGSQHILSVASCFINGQNTFKDKYYTVIANTLNLHSQQSTILTVERIYVSKDLDHSTINRYSSRSIGNLAVLKLTNSLELGRNYPMEKVTLPQNPTASDYESDTPLVSGYGMSAGDRHPEGNLFYLCNTLYAAATRVIPNRLCQAGFTYRLHEKHLCAKILPLNRKPIGTCHGDIGSPLVGEGNILIGVLTAFRPDCNEKEHAALYTRISSYVSFIRRAMDETPSPHDTRYAVYKNRDMIYGMIGGGMTLEEYYHHL